MKNLIIDTRMVDEHLHGIARYTYEIINNLQHYNDINLHLLTNDENLTKAIFHDSSKLSFINMKTKFLSIKEQLELPIKLNKFSSDYIFHSPSFSNSPIVKLDTIMTIHDLNHLRFPQFYTPIHKYYYEYIVKPAAKKCKKIITVSQFSKTELMEWLNCSEEKIEVTYNGVDSRFKEINKVEILNRAREKYKLPERFILYVGNQKPHKNVETLLMAMSNVKEDIQLVLNGKITEEFKKKLEEYKVLNKVKFIGFIDDEDLPVLYNLASIFVFPSLYEGFGLPPLEAMACGCPVITSNTSSLPEVVGDAAVTFNPKDYIELSEKINEVLGSESKSSSMKIKGIKQAQSFTWEKTTEQTYKIYNELFKS